MKEHGKWYIKVDGMNVEVSEEVYHAYWQYTEKERYFMETLKKGKFVYDEKNDTALYCPSKEDSLERLDSCGIEFPDTSMPMPEEAAANNEIMALLNQALESLHLEERQLLLDYYYLERTEREIAEFLHTAASTVHYRKKRVLDKLKKYLEKNL